MADLDILEELAVDTSNGDHDVFAHYAEKDLITEAMVFGTPIVALCGKIWVPFRNPEKYPVCPICDEIFKSMAGAGGSSGPTSE
jgi:hypothetical protein